ncbi:hypothetical protein F4776DRAFT_629163 [Hypoxylon sp. NC0597]|nr:hypothetical protein F4776DRAFT_629163 [Hypoxylon sp. NC0597]
MSLTDPVIIGIISLVIMCIPGVHFLYRMFRRRQLIRRRQHAYESEETPGRTLDRILPLSSHITTLTAEDHHANTNSDSFSILDQPFLLESGMVYATRSARSETFMAWPWPAASRNARDPPSRRGTVNGGTRDMGNDN